MNSETNEFWENSSIIQCPVKINTLQNIEHFSRVLLDDDIEFPKDYPPGCLLGSVDVVDCLGQEEYRQKVYSLEFFFSFVKTTIGNNSIYCYTQITNSNQQMRPRFVLVLNGKH